MNSTATILFGGFALLLAAAAWTLASAVSGAEDGYEDALGFHRDTAGLAAGLS